MSAPGSDTTVSQWLELFFDLIAVAAVAVITDGIAEDPTWGGLALAALTFVVIWQSWLSVVLYANVAEDKVRIPTVVIAMFAIALMAAAAPGHYDSRANAFVIGFLIARSAAAGAAQRTGKVLASYPLLQAGGLSAPWIVSLWVATPGKYVLWAVGLALDMWVLLKRSVDADQTIERLPARYDRAVAKRSERGRGEAPERIEAVDIDTSHLDERLGLFVIIVLGEIVVQIVGAASRTDWGSHLMVTVGASFALIVCLWWLMFTSGTSEAAHTRMATLAPRVALPLHLLSTMGIVMLAAGLGAAAVAPDRSIDPMLARIMVAGLGVHLLATTVTTALSGTSRRWLAVVGIPSVVACALVAVIATELDDNKELIFVMLLIALWAVGWSIFGRRTYGPGAVAAEAAASA
jgi:low temperature requirement protein LtrA